MNGTDQTGDFVTSLERCLAWNMRSEQVPLEIIPETMQQLPIAAAGLGAEAASASAAPQPALSEAAQQ